MGFPTPGIAHLLRNPYDTELVYLMGGEAVPLDVLDYPTLGKRFLLVYAGGPPDFVLRLREITFKPRICVSLVTISLRTPLAT